MKSLKLLALNCLIALMPFVGLAISQDGVTRTEDIIYGRKFGTALTLDSFVPKQPNDDEVRHRALMARLDAVVAMQETLQSRVDELAHLLPPGREL